MMRRKWEQSLGRYVNARILVLVGTLDTCWYVENKWSRGNISTDGFRNGHAFLYQDRMSPIFWVFAYRHATWIYNRILHSTLEVIQSFLNSCMPEEHALIDCIFCFVIVTIGFLDLHLESTRGGRCIFRAFIDMRCSIFGIRTGVANGLNSLQRGVWWIL